MIFLTPCTGKQWRQKQIQKITDKVFDHFKNETGRANLTFEDLYIAVLLVYKYVFYLFRPGFFNSSKNLLIFFLKILYIHRDNILITNKCFCCSDINKRLPGPHFDPPSKEQVRSLMLVCYDCLIYCFMSITLVSNLCCERN